MFLDDAVKAGEIHYIGLSNFTGWQLQIIVSTAKAMGVQVPVCTSAAIQPAVPRNRVGDHSGCAAQWDWPAAVLSARGRLPIGQISTGWDCTRGHPRRFRKTAVSGGPGGICGVRSQLGDDRCGCSHRQGDRRDTGAGRLELDRKPPKCHCSDRRCSDSRTSTRQPRRGRPGAGQGRNGGP